MGGMSPEDIFSNFFSGGFNPMNMGGFNRRKKAERIVEKVPVSLKELYMGKTKVCRVNITKLCKKCNGIGCDKVNKCNKCNGNGIVFIRRVLGPGMMTITKQLVLIVMVKVKLKIKIHCVRNVMVMVIKQK